MVIFCDWGRGRPFYVGYCSLADTLDLLAFNSTGLFLKFKRRLVGRRIFDCGFCWLWIHMAMCSKHRAAKEMNTPKGMIKKAVTILSYVIGPKVVSSQAWSARSSKCLKIQIRKIVLMTKAVILNFSAIKCMYH